MLANGPGLAGTGCDVNAVASLASGEASWPHTIRALPAREAEAAD